MTRNGQRRRWLQRIAAGVIALVVVPLVLVATTLKDDAPIRVGDAAPRTVITAETVRVVDVETTQRARDAAADAVPPIVESDSEATATTIRRVRDVFAAVADVRTPAMPEPAPPPSPAAEGEEPEPVPSPTPVVPSAEEQLEALRERVPFLDDVALQRLIGLSDRQLGQVQPETVAVAQQLARQRIDAQELDRMLNEQLPVELSLRTFPESFASEVVEPLIRAVMQPTVRVNEAATDAARQQARAEVADVVRTWPTGTAIIRSGEVVDALQFAALQQTGLEGTDPWRVLVRAFGAMAIVIGVLALYLRVSHPEVWRSGRKVLLLAWLVLGYTGLAAGTVLLTDAAGNTWWYALPAGGLAMLVAILVAPAIGVAMALPAVAIPFLLDARAGAVLVFFAAAVVVAVPLSARLSSRADLHRVAWRSMVAYAVLAGAGAAVLEAPEIALLAAGAGLAHGVLVGLIVNGVLPILESLFRFPSVTTLLDLADRNHPLLRELEQKAIGSYNHSVMVATLVERACRAIGANALLGSVASLYHDIGKVRRPHFFIENQQGIPNPHDEIEPEVSAVIIQNHVVDGVEMAREYRLPPEVVAAIGSHHGTTVVTYFYRRALEAAEGTGQHVDEEHFRYKGTRPRRKEAAVLMLADCCEATTRSMAMEHGTLSREAIETTVDGLFAERVDDGQLDQADLTFAELSTIRDSIVDALVGVYHPRIAYPQAPQRAAEPAPATEPAAS